MEAIIMPSLKGLDYIVSEKMPVFKFLLVGGGGEEPGQISFHRLHHYIDWRFFMQDKKLNHT